MKIESEPLEIQVEDLPKQDTQAEVDPTVEPTEHLALLQHFNIDIPNKQETGKLQEIWEYGKKMSKSGDIQDVIWQVMHLERTLGAPRLGESRLDRLYRWAKLKRQETRIAEELKSV